MDPPEEQPFRFLDLPREMRDNVYDLLIIGNETTFHKPELALPVSGQKYLPTNALLVNRQINSEIKRRGNVFEPTLSLTDEEGFNCLRTPSLVVPPSTKIIRIRLFAMCRMQEDCQHRKSDTHCRIPLVVLDHFEWIELWLSLTSEPCNFGIDAQIFLGAETGYEKFHPDTIEDTQAPWQVASFTQLPALRKVRVYAGADTNYDLRCFTEEFYFTT